MSNIAQGLEDCLYIGNMDALRCWGDAKDYARMPCSRRMGLGWRWGWSGNLDCAECTFLWAICDSVKIWGAMDRITLEPGKRGGLPCIRGLRISVHDILGMLSNGMSQEEVLDDFPELDREDIMAALAYAADREHKVFSPKVQ
jgi:uncharacterized protein (DUF433 family)